MTIFWCFATVGARALLMAGMCLADYLMNRKLRAAKRRDDAAAARNRRKAGKD